MPDFDYLSRSYSEPLNFEEEDDYLLVKDHQIPVRPGEKLPNGSILLMEVVIRKFPHRRDSMVLCIARGYTPFVSWIRTITSDVPERNDDGSRNTWYNIRDFCESGDYYSHLDQAVANFARRVNDKKELFA